MNEDTNRLDYPERELSDAEVFEQALRNFDDEDDLFCGEGRTDRLFDDYDERAEET